MVRTRRQVAEARAAQPQAETDGRRNVVREHAGRGKGSPKRITLNDVEQAFRKLVQQGVNTESTLKKKIAVIRSLTRHWLRHKNIGLDRLATYDLKQMLGSAEFLEWLPQVYPNQSTRATTLGAIVSLLDVLGSRTVGVNAVGYDAIWNSMQQEAAARDRQRDQNEPRDFDVDISWDRIVAAEKQLRDTEFASEQHLVLALYVLLPPRRGDYFDCRYVTREPAADGKNYIVVPENEDDPCWVILGSYKTVRAYGRYLVKLSPDSQYAKYMTDINVLNETIREYAKEKTLRSNDLFFPDRNGNANSARFHSVLKAALFKTTGVHLGIRNLRRMYVTHINAGPPLSTADRKNIAYMCGHSLSTADTYRQLDQLQEAYEARGDNTEAYDTVLNDSQRLVDVLQRIGDIIHEALTT